MLPMKPKLEPSPSPDDESLPPESPVPEMTERKGRKRRHQAYLGDRVLINTLGNDNYPDIGATAGKSPLNSDSEPDEPMNVDTAAGGLKLLQTTAQNVLDVVEVKAESSHGRSVAVKQELGRRARPPRLETQDLVSRSREPSRIRSCSTPRVAAQALVDAQASESKSSEAAPQSALPKLSEHTISQPEGSSKETLPAIQSSSSTDPKSPAYQQNLPSFQEINRMIPSEETTAQNAMEIRQRQTFPLPSSPSSAFLPRTAATFPSPQTRMNGFAHPTYAHNQPSPATAMSSDGPSPRDTTFGMSPPGTRSNGPYYVQARTPVSDQMTPMSADSFAGTGTPFSSEMSPNGIEGRPILPPIPGNGNLVSTVFKCDYQDCNAAPFSTQYLLK